jgi:hypothetical protein
VKLPFTSVLSETVCVFVVTPLPLADTVTVIPVPSVAVGDAVSVTVPVVEPPAIDSVLAVTPVGSPATDMSTAPEKSPVRVIVTGSDAVAPCSSDIVVAPTASVIPAGSTVVVGVLSHAPLISAASISS